VNLKIAGKWMFIPLKMVLIGIDPTPFLCWFNQLNPQTFSAKWFGLLQWPTKLFRRAGEHLSATVKQGMMTCCCGWASEILHQKDG
jgi:hypothetical protein